MADPATDSMIEGVTRETHDDVKKLADDRATKLAAAEAKLHMYEQRERDQLKTFQPAMEGMLKELMDEAPVETRGHFSSMLDWSRTASERPNIDTQMQLGCVVHACASKLKRVREDASLQKSTAEQLAASAKENEALKTELAQKSQRIGDLDASLKEITANSDTLRAQVEKAKVLEERFDFSKATSREESPPVGDAADGVVTKTENASKGLLTSVPSFNPADALAKFVSSNAGLSSNRFMPSTSSNHALLGGSGVESFNAAIRPM